MVIDADHGQTRWQATGFTTRDAHHSFSGLVSLAAEHHVESSDSAQKLRLDRFPLDTILLVPPPTGSYDPHHESWRKDPSTLFSPDEIVALLRFVRNGGRLLAFAYRFGDSFTQGNLKDLFSPLGCHLNDDAVLDLEQLLRQHPLKSQFETPSDLLVQPWARDRVRSVYWRTMATFTILPGAAAQPVVLSPGGRCITFNRTTREISFESTPVMVAGSFGKGRFVLVGGPHAFESGPLGLIDHGDNRRFAATILRWLSAKAPDDLNAPVQTSGDAAVAERWREFSRIQGRGKGEKLVQFVERLLRKRGILKALSRARWDC